jgi:TATA-box binding protein (TBP) (component of TFIID and TFIIIB)
LNFFVLPNGLYKNKLVYFRFFDVMLTYKIHFKDLKNLPKKPLEGLGIFSITSQLNAALKMKVQNIIESTNFDIFEKLEKLALTFIESSDNQRS